MRNFFDKNLFLSCESSKVIYDCIKNMPIIDFHCHLNEHDIMDDKKFENITDLWLRGDHYKWRLMRLLGVDEKYITGNATDEEKFRAFASVIQRAPANPVYYWAHMELKSVFGINEPLSEINSDKIFTKTKKEIDNISVRYLLDKFRVEFVATTNDPTDTLDAQGVYGNTVVSPTFRPDKVFTLKKEYISKLAESAGMEINNIDDLKVALEKRLQFFISKGCKISDHGMDFFPDFRVDEKRAGEIFTKYDEADDEEKYEFFSHMMIFLSSLYKKYGIIMQIHSGTFRNVNSKMFEITGPDSGFDIFRSYQDTDKLVYFLNYLSTNDILPVTLLYVLNPNTLKSLCTLTGAFREVSVSAAWWFNDTVLGIKEHLKTLSEYSVLGTNMGMLTDSRSFTSYVRFDFFRRILSDYLGQLVEKGEYEIQAAAKLAGDISYRNIKELLKL